ncbi:Glutamate carboxypeptidase 2, partial [Armadillidium nasatum]
MEVNTHNQRTTTYNVVGVMKGIEEPDRYVILGNHRDAWIFGAVDPSSASAVMLELTRVLTEYRRETGWSPRRSLVFCSWGSEEYGLVGSQEWVEQFQKQLSNRGIVYLNLDMAIEGNYTVRTKSSPLLYNIGREISKLVPNPDPEEVKAGRSTVFDTWLYRNPDEKRPGYPSPCLNVS